MSPYLFVVLNFCVGFFSDIILNFLSTKRGSQLFNSKIIISLRPYFNNHGIIHSAINAGVTIIAVLALVMFTSQFILGFNTPKNIKQLVFFLLLSAIYGYIADVFIDKFEIFGDDLKPYYKQPGAKFWGATALVFSIVISYTANKLILRYL